jgi:hypothetical protein
LESGGREGWTGKKISMVELRWEEERTTGKAGEGEGGWKEGKR